MFNRLLLHRIVIYFLVLVLSALILIFSYYSINELTYLYQQNFSAKESQLNFLEAADVVTAKPNITLLFGGDVMLSRTVNAKMVSYNDYAWPLKLLAPTLEAADLSIINLESPFLENANYQVPSGSFSFRANPLALESLLVSGVDVVSLANNHILNAGQKGIEDTINLLTTNKIATVGAGLNEEAARAATLMTVNGWQIAFLAYAYPNDYSVATAERPGIAYMDHQNLAVDIKQVRDQTDLVIVIMHAGEEYTTIPNTQQKRFAHEAIDLGADVVIGHHPHWPQSWEIYKDKPIFYSLGNLVFDQMWSEQTRHGVLARLVFQEDLSGQAELIPIIINDYGQADLWPQDKNEAQFWQLYDLDMPGEIIWP